MSANLKAGLRALKEQIESVSKQRTIASGQSSVFEFILSVWIKLLIVRGWGLSGISRILYKS